jgi:hypothetical protein
MRKPEMLELTIVTTPIRSTSGVPNGYYVDAVLCQHEQNLLFHNNWTAANFGEDFP